jgi:3'-phosphoadenosine 5'-phosphosulfate sulfotransferase (PAPS reductase)/FAD synthetase
MKHIVCFSGGKDSTALVLWAKENLAEFTTVFCDTGWEHPITYAYIEEINQTVLSGELVTLRSKRYSGFVDCVLDHGMIPGTQSRFCTQDLKIEPIHTYFATLNDEITSYQGIRADESRSRAAMLETQWVDEAGGYWIKRPLLRWSATQCFERMAQSNVKPNPLYLLGAGRVGCFPCIMVNHRELKALLKTTPELRERIISLETQLQFVQAHRREKREAIAADTGKPMKPRYARKWPSTFFRAGFIPTRFCAFKGRNEQGEVVGIPTAQEVFRYIESADENQLPMFPTQSCMSVYNLCE